MTANTPRTRKEKGNRAERIVATAYRQSGLFPNAQRMPMSGAMQFHKGDIFKGEYDIFVDEVKCQEKVQLWAWWDQAVSQCGINQQPVLHITRNHSPMLTVMRMESYMDLRKTIKDLEEYSRDLEKKIAKGVKS